jgi:hypothetical protein
MKMVSEDSRLADYNINIAPCAVRHKRTGPQVRQGTQARVNLSKRLKFTYDYKVIAGFESWQRQDNFLCTKSSRPALVHTQYPIQSILGIKRPGREADNSPSFISQHKYQCCTHSVPSMPSRYKQRFTSTVAL